VGELGKYPVGAEKLPLWFLIYKQMTEFYTDEGFSTVILHRENASVT
jgi:hypothetical protein